MFHKNKHQWFEKVRNSYLPKSWQGYLIYMSYVAYVVLLPIGWYRRGHAIWDLFTVVIPLWIAAALVTQYIASKRS